MEEKVLLVIELTAGCSAIEGWKIGLFVNRFDCRL